MSLFITSLNSGSNGNCYYLGNSDEAVLVDVGISCKEVEKRMERLGLSLNTLKAIFISHEHSDHIKGLEVLSKKYALPVYITGPTLQNSRLDLNHHLVKNFNGYESILIGNLIIKAFQKRHDAADPYSFTIEGAGVKVGVLTDIGSVCEQVIQNFKQCHAVFLEANYDDVMLDEGNYPYYLKTRIRSEKGHLSNSQALDLFRNHRSESLHHVILSHLSKDNNCPIVVKDLFEKHAAQTKVTVASRFHETEVFNITANGVVENLMKSNLAFQTSLF